MAEEMDDDGDCYMRQRLLYAEEVYLYKIPPMKDANGHRSVVFRLITCCELQKSCSCSSMLTPCVIAVQSRRLESSQPDQDMLLTS
jgi:hypothetical protein